MRGSMPGTPGAFGNLASPNARFPHAPGAIKALRTGSRNPCRTISSLSVGIEVNALEFLDLSDGNSSSYLSLEHGASGLYILSDKGHHLLTLVGIGHVRRDWKIDQSVLGEDDDR